MMLTCIGVQGANSQRHGCWGSRVPQKSSHDHALTGYRVSGCMFLARVKNPGIWRHCMLCNTIGVQDGLTFGDWSAMTAWHSVLTYRKGTEKKIDLSALTGHVCPVGSLVPLSNSALYLTCRIVVRFPPERSKFIHHG